MKKFLPIVLCVLSVAVHAADATSRASNSGVAAAIAAARTTTTRSAPDMVAPPADSAAVASRNSVNTVSGRTPTTAASTTDAAARRAGVVTRPSTTAVINRAAVESTPTAATVPVTITNVSPRNATVDRAAVSRVSITPRIPSIAARQDDNLPTAASIAEATSVLENTATLNASCQTQYNDCMDQFCSVIDANQKRCSCSANLSRYTRVESAVKDANTQLNDVAQRIRYVGLSADEIRAIMTATEAELVLDKTTDNTESRDMLTQIEDLIKNPSAATTSGGNISLLDLDLDFSSDPMDIFNLDFLTGNTGSFSNMRGTELFNAAKKRCQPILARCADAGGTQTQIVANYDLAIDRDCIAYEAGLTKMNETLLSNVRSANLMLQKARLAVLNNKNQYDAKACVGALDTCMKDEMVCGANYTKCLDPTKRYIDENGEVVLGQDISQILTFMKNYNNADIGKSFLSRARTQSYAVAACAADPTTNQGGNDGSCNVRYLLEKIGMGDKPTDGGLCRAVLDKCQRYTYSDRGNYDPLNDIVVNYVQRAMVNIKSGQQKLIADYAENCMVDVAACYNQQVSQVNAWSSSAGKDSVYNVMRGACRNIALTCAYGVFYNNGSGLCTNESTCINDISEMFYQSLLCPENSTHISGTAVLPSLDGSISLSGAPKYANARCQCNVGYVVWSGECKKKCVPGSYRNQTNGVCVQCPAGTYCPGTDTTEAAAPTPCASETTSPAGSSVATACQ